MIEFFRKYVNFCKFPVCIYICIIKFYFSLSLCPSTTLDGSLVSSDVVSKRRIRNGSVLYGDTLQDFHQHRLQEGYDPLDLKYSLYAIAVSN